MNIRCTDTITYSDLIHDCYAQAPRFIGAGVLTLVSGHDKTSCIHLDISTFTDIRYKLPLEMLLIALQLYHSIAHRHLLQGATSAPRQILQAVYQDGAIYFVLVFAMRLWTGLMV